MMDSFKEYFDLNDHYLKIRLTQEKIHFICFNTISLDGIIYQLEISEDDMKKNQKYKELDLKQLFEKITNSIDNKHCLISNQNNCISLSLIEGENFDINKDLQFVLVKTDEKIPEYEDVMKKIINDLRNENTNMKNKFDELNLEKKAKSVEFLNYPGKPSKSGQENNQNQNEIKEEIVQANQSNPFIQGGNEKPQNVVIDNKEKKKAFMSSSYKQFQPKKSMELSISTLANLNYSSYPPVELSSESYSVIAGYGGNSYNGLIRKSNEDRIKIIPNYKLSKPVKIKSGEIINPHISYFAIYDGHGGNKCSNFLQENLHDYIFSSDAFPLYTLKAINSAYIQAEKKFFSMVTDSGTGNLNDKSGSCSVSILIIDEWCFVTNLGDSRGLYSLESGNKFLQITRDHKPNDPIERERIEKAGGSIYKDDIVTLKGEKVKMDEKNLPPGFNLPYRIVPGNLAVRNNF